MEQYIPKSALVAEIESRMSDIKISQKAGLIKKYNAETKIIILKSILSLINTLEVKEDGKTPAYRGREPLRRDLLRVRKWWIYGNHRRAYAHPPVCISRMVIRCKGLYSDK